MSLLWNLSTVLYFFLIVEQSWFRAFIIFTDISLHAILEYFKAALATLPSFKACASVLLSSPVSFPDR